MECKTTKYIRSENDADKSRCLQIVDLPTDIMERILGYLPFVNIAKLRSVSKYFNDICCMMLSSEFFCLRAYMFERLHTIREQMPRRESSRRKHPLAREHEIIETIHMRLSLLYMTLGKHIGKNHCCFFPGEIIDEVHRILKYIKDTSNLNEAYKITDELFDLTTMAMEYFREHIEPTLPENKYFGCPSMNYVLSSRTSPTKALVVNSNASKVSVHQENDSFSKLKNRVMDVGNLAKRNEQDIATVKRSLKAARKKVTGLQQQLRGIKRPRKRSRKSLIPNICNFSEVLYEMRRHKLQLQMLALNLSSDNTYEKAGFKCMPLDSTSTHFHGSSTVQEEFLKFSDLCKKSSFMYDPYDDMEVVTCEVSSLKKNSSCM
ncbi:F-box only protein 28, partial [Stegodyphus mimosarum]